MSMTVLILVSAATLIGFFVGLVVMGLINRADSKRDNSRYDDMVEHQRIVEARLSRYSDHAERTADALEAIADTMGRNE